MSSLSSGDLSRALSGLAQNRACRDSLVALLKDFERAGQAQGINLREEVTGPIVDALYRDAGDLQKTLACGLEIHFSYRSKIARDFIMAENAPDHVWEPQTTKILLALGRDAGHAIIGGAYFGDHAVPLAAAMRAGGGICHCFEINPEQFALLRLNAHANGLSNLVANQRGLWDRDEASIVLVGDDSHAAPRETADPAAVGAFPVVSINSYGRSHGISQIGLIMLDIEGGELQALQGASAYLGQPAPQAPNVIFEIHRSYVDWSRGLQDTGIVRLLEESGYSVFAIRDYQGNVPMANHPPEVIPAREVYLEGPPHGFNMLAVKDLAVLSREGFVVRHGVSPKLLFHRDPKLHQPLT